MRLQGKVALVTGGGSGIGRAIAERLAAEGAAVVIAARNAKRLREAVQAIRERGGRAVDIPVDVTDRASVEELARATASALGVVDILVNNSAIYPLRPILELPETDWRATLETNLSGAFRCIQVFAPAMVERRWGRIINIVSPSASVGFPATGAYAASKGGLVALTRCAAMDLGAYGVTVNCVCPGVTATEQFVQAVGPATVARFKKLLPLRRTAEENECTGAVAFLASEEAAYVTGATLTVDGGLLAGFPMGG